MNGATTGFLYDGAQAIAELRGGSIDTVYHTGMQIDEVLAHYAPTGNKTLLTDALMSVIAQTNDAQNAENFYAYSAYGETAVLGPDGGNALRYTGREDDGNGLFYYRARYYDPVLKRFVSEDPIGLEAGPNLFAFVDGDPVSLVDPDGLNPLDPLFGLISQATGGAQVPQSMVNAVAGFGNGVSLGLTNYINNQLGIGNQVNQCSTAYQAGNLVSFALGAGRLTYAGLAKGYSVMAATPAAASAYRTKLRVAFGGGPNLRPPNLGKYTSGPALRAGAGRTNPFWNAYGAGVTAQSAVGACGWGVRLPLARLY